MKPYWNILKLAGILISCLYGVAVVLLVAITGILLGVIIGEALL